MIPEHLYSTAVMRSALRAPLTDMEKCSLISSEVLCSMVQFGTTMRASFWEEEPETPRMWFVRLWVTWESPSYVVVGVFGV